MHPTTPRTPRGATSPSRNCLHTDLRTLRRVCRDLAHRRNSATLGCDPPKSRSTAGSSPTSNPVLQGPLSDLCHIHPADYVLSCTLTSVFTASFQTSPGEGRRHQTPGVERGWHAVNYVKRRQTVDSQAESAAGGACAAHDAAPQLGAERGTAVTHCPPETATSFESICAPGPTTIPPQF